MCLALLGATATTNTTTTNTTYQIKAILANYHVITVPEGDEKVNPGKYLSLNGFLKYYLDLIGMEEGEETVRGDLDGFGYRPDLTKRNLGEGGGDFLVDFLRGIGSDAASAVKQNKVVLQLNALGDFLFGSFEFYERLIVGLSGSVSSSLVMRIVASISATSSDVSWKRLVVETHKTLENLFQSGQEHAVALELCGDILVTVASSSGVKAFESIFGGIGSGQNNFGLLKIAKELATHPQKNQMNGDAGITMCIGVMQRLYVVDGVKVWLNEEERHGEWNWIKRYVEGEGGGGGGGGGGEGGSGIENENTPASYSVETIGLTKILDSDLVGFDPNQNKLNESNPYLLQFVNIHTTDDLGFLSQIPLDVDEPENNKIIVYNADFDAEGEYTYTGRSDCAGGIWRKLGTKLCIYVCTLDDAENTMRWYLSATFVEGDIPGTQRDTDLYYNQIVLGGKRFYFPSEEGWECEREVGGGNGIGNGNGAKIPILRFQRNRISICRGEEGARRGSLLMNHSNDFESNYADSDIPEAIVVGVGEMDNTCNNNNNSNMLTGNSVDSAYDDSDEFEDDVAPHPDSMRR